MRGTAEQKCGVKDSLVELNAGQLSLLSDQQQIDILKRLHAASPQFRFFTADEAKDAGNVWVEESRPSDRNTLVSRRSWVGRIEADELPERREPSVSGERHLTFFTVFAEADAPAFSGFAWSGLLVAKLELGYEAATKQCRGSFHSARPT